MVQIHNKDVPALPSRGAVDFNTGLNLSIPLGPQREPGFWTSPEGEVLYERLKKTREYNNIPDINDLIFDLKPLEVAAEQTIGTFGTNVQATVAKRYPAYIPQRALNGTSAIKVVQRGTQAHEPAPYTSADDIIRELNMGSSEKKELPLGERLSWGRKSVAELVTEMKAPGGSNGPAPGASAALNRYWTKGKGLAKWANTATPYRSLVKALRAKGVPARMIHGLAATYYHQVKGTWPGKHGSKS